MRFKISLSKKEPNAPAVTCVGWRNTEEVISAGDDNQLLSWTVSNREPIKITEFGPDLNPTDLHFMPRGNVGGTAVKQNDLILLTATDGKFYIVHRNGRFERSVEAHKGAVLVGAWSYDGNGLLTGGEDGFIKIWSRSGMLRSTLVSSDSSIYAAVWSGDSKCVAYTQDKQIVIKHLAPNIKPEKWKAHDGLVLALAWSEVNDLIISGGEDCRYKVWNSQGHQLFSSTLHDYPIMSLAWSPNGDVFAVGSYNTLRLCDHAGWSRSLDKLSTGCIYKMSWSKDGTQLAGACANGHVLFAHIIEKQVNYFNFEAVVTGRKTISVRDTTTDAQELLELPERIIQVALKYSHLVATTPSQCYIYSTSNWNTPIIFDLKDGCVSLLLMSEKYLLIGERNTINIYNHQGRLVASPRWPNMRLESLTSSQISLSSDTFVVMDILNLNTVYIIDLGSNRSISENAVSIHHDVSICQISLNQAGDIQQRCVAILDKNKCIYICQIKTPYKELHKLGSQVHSFLWNTEQNMIAAIQDTNLVVWYCPTACFNATALKFTTKVYDSYDLGSNPRINDFVGNFVTIRRGDGALVSVCISPYPAALSSLLRGGNLKEAVNLCRKINDKTLWMCLAVYVISNLDVENLSYLEEAFAATDQYDAVDYVLNLKKQPTKSQQMAGLSLLGGSMQNAEAILLHNGQVAQAIMMNVQMYQWNRALDLAILNIKRT
ncbi:intraflagellar transport protein 80 homolog [Agrilus planipennis]|uniref:Intraflagellar transport protein 80 homolog n=1 Tax=Agrilus planipennis TaxID=224129 RepID=A0A1W4WPT0_AGRPL|nr:intraflagellar transport protein 80 homolog [Agrilus planipennis]